MTPTHNKCEPRPQQVQQYGALKCSGAKPIFDFHTGLNILALLRKLWRVRAVLEDQKGVEEDSVIHSRVLARPLADGFAPFG